MNNQQSTIILTFQQWFRMIPASTVRETRNTIIERCHLKKDEKGFCPVFYHWLTGRTPVPPLAQPIIMEVAKQQLTF
jgi:hypothetical protein